MKNLKILIIIFILLTIPLFTKGAVLYLEPSEASYNQGDTFLIDVRIDTEGEYINAVEVNLSFDEDILQIEDISQGNSVLSLWLNEPSFSENEISFMGGIPGGYQGIDGLIGRLIFKSKKMGFAQINFQKNSKVLLNDGWGTKTGLVFRGGEFNIKEAGTLEDEWQKELEKDNIPPQPFKVEFNQDPSIFEGKYFVSFFTTDKETGIDYYEIKEGKREWKKAVSPYVLENQKLTDDIWVKAVDKAGNEWIEIVEASKKSAWECVFNGILVLIVILVIIIIGWFVVKRRIKK